MIVQEGSAQIYLENPLNEKTDQKQADVFYNKVQVFNRDISLLAASSFMKRESPKKFRFLDALTATGLRAIRFRKEISEDLIEGIVGCDLSSQAVEIFNENLKLNGLENDPKIRIEKNDANIHMFNTPYQTRYDIIDLDPYGSMIPFLHATLKAVVDNGLLCITCTDSRVLMGSDHHKCFYLYRAARSGSDSPRSLGIRIILGAIQAAAN